MGVVYAATDVALRRKVAIKTIDPFLASDESFLLRFQSEAQALAKINDPHIVQVYSLRQTEELTFIVMEFVAGETLSRVLSKGALQWNRVRRYMEQMLAAIGHAHQLGVIHRDIKPANIMISAEDQVKILDFGLAKHDTSADLTLHGRTVGTVAYMSPERLKGEPSDRRSDIWALGIILYEMLTGKRPFGGGHEQTVALAILESEPEPISHLNADVPPGVEQVLARCLAKNPADRYQSTKDLLEALRRLGEAIDPESTVAVRTVPLESARDHRLPWGRRAWSGRWITAAALLAFLPILAFGAYKVIRNHSSEDQIPGAARLVAVTIHTFPPGARVVIDENSLDAVTPLKEIGLPPGPVRLGIEKEGYVSLDTMLVIEENSPLTFSFHLRSVEDRRFEPEEVTGDSLSPPGGVSNNPQPVSPPPFRSVGDVASHVASALRQEISAGLKKPAIDVAIAIHPFTYRDSKVVGPFSRSLRLLLISKLQGDGIQAMSSADAARPKQPTHFLSGTYREGTDTIEFRTILTSASSARSAGVVSVSIPRTILNQPDYALTPPNYDQMSRDLTRLEDGAVVGKRLKLDVWTNRGSDGLLFENGDTMKVFVRVNEVGYVRFIYHQADGSRILLVNESYVGPADVNKVLTSKTFVCSPPFGAEILHVFAQTEPFPSLRTRSVGAADLLLDDLEQILATSRSAATEPGVVAAERHLVITTSAP